MSEEKSNQYIRVIRQQIETLRKQVVSAQIQQQQLLSKKTEKITASLGNLQLFQEQMEASLEAMEVIQEELLEQNEYLAEEQQRYYDLFYYAPDAYLLTDAQGIILEANHAAAELFNALQNFLIGKPLLAFVVETEYSSFWAKLNEMPYVDSVQEWEIVMRPLNDKPFDAMLMVSRVANPFRTQGHLRISIRNITKYKQANLQQPAIVSQLLPQAPKEVPQSLDGLQVLFVDDEADVRDFITTVLEQHGISVTAVSSADEALFILEQSHSHPDVLISDIRMPNGDGYTLIKKVRELEAHKGWKIPAAALTAYLAEDRAKALKAGFQSHLHKLAEPTELIAMVARLAGR